MNTINCGAKKYTETGLRECLRLFGKTYIANSGKAPTLENCKEHLAQYNYAESSVYQTFVSLRDYFDKLTESHAHWRASIKNTRETLQQDIEENAAFFKDIGYSLNIVAVPDMKVGLFAKFHMDSKDIQNYKVADTVIEPWRGNYAIQAIPIPGFKSKRVVGMKVSFITARGETSNDLIIAIKRYRAEIEKKKR